MMIFDWRPFADWLNEKTSDNDTRPMEERGLKPGAPPEAVEVYEKYCVIMEDKKRRGVK